MNPTAPMAPPAPAGGPALPPRLAGLVERHFGAAHALPPELRHFLAAVSDAYESAEDESAALRASDDQFRELAEHVAAATFIYKGTKFLYVNAAATELTGYPQHELLGMDFWEVVHPTHRELVRERGMAWQRGEPIEPRYEFKIARKNGEERWVDFTLGGVTYAGEPAGLGTCFDVTAHKVAEEALERQALTFENLYDAVIISDPSGRIVDWNPAAERIYGGARAEVIGLSGMDLWLGPEEGETLNREILEGIDVVGRWQGEVRFVRRDGTRGVSETVVVPLQDARGRRVGDLGG